MLLPISDFFVDEGDMLEVLLAFERGPERADDDAGRGRETCQRQVVPGGGLRDRRRPRPDQRVAEQRRRQQQREHEQHEPRDQHAEHDDNHRGRVAEYGLLGQAALAGQAVQQKILAPNDERRGPGQSGGRADGSDVKRVVEGLFA